MKYQTKRNSACTAPGGVELRIEARPQGALYGCGAEGAAGIADEAGGRDRAVGAHDESKGHVLVVHRLRLRLGRPAVAPLLDERHAPGAVGLARRRLGIHLVRFHWIRVRARGRGHPARVGLGRARDEGVAGEVDRPPRRLLRAMIRPAWAGGGGRESARRGAGWTALATGGRRGGGSAGGGGFGGGGGGGVSSTTRSRLISS